jgi:hypothetical protein
MEDVFKDVSFSDATISTNGSAVNPGANADSPPAKGAITGDSPKPDANQGTDGKGKVDTKTTDDPTKKVDGSTAAEKPLPYDKDPKWLKARAAEKTLQDLKDEFGLSSDDEVRAFLAKGKSLHEKLGTRDADQLLKDADDAAKARAEKAKADEAQKRSGETPEQTIARLERNQQVLQRQIEENRRAQEDYAESERAIAQYTQDINSVIDSLDEPVAETHRGMLATLLGVDNPMNEFDITDRASVRKAAKGVVGKFNEFVKTVKQEAIDEYAKGKSKLTVTQPGGGHDATTTTKTAGEDLKPLPKGLSVDDVFAQANREMAEVLVKGLANAP